MVRRLVGEEVVFQSRLGTVVTPWGLEVARASGFGAIPSGMSVNMVLDIRDSLNDESGWDWCCPDDCCDAEGY